MTSAQEPRSHGGATEGLAVHEALARLLSDGRRVAVATIVRARGSHPRSVGAKMLVPDAGAPLFSIGGGPLEASAIADCRAALDGAAPAVHRYDLTEGGDDSVGMTCGGSVEIFIDVEEPPRRLFVFGAGHVGRAVAAAAHVAGLLVEVVDDRAEWLDASAFPEGARLHRCAPDYASGLPAIPPEALAVVMTRCHATDLAVLRSLARSRPRHVGFMGSRRKVLRAFAVLRSEGVETAWLDTVRAPIGLALGAETPGEIAISVVAEIVAVLRAPASATAQEAARPLTGTRRP